ncbi:uncharacterized protein LOC133485954 [Phyllopteryx taeniolatus]|uniref:uncharacterized protein LOC133485954 n=1 Tax=Phyllopteryx taeniolatus TaxID=161469 RepID=UPI002AD2595D|nr:uncharacterized protein LOC133485954 [Phyllopteryx taeniolatus]
MKELMVTFWILLSLLLVHLSSEHPTCEVTHDTKGWHYKISGNDTAPCTRYQWTNGTELVLATHRPRDKSVSDKVIQKSEKYLHLAVCVEDIQRNRECPSQNFLRVVTCPVNCTEMYEVSRSTVLLVHLSSEHPTCEVTHDTKGWHYKISGNDTAPCTRYQWTNGTELVLATHRPRDKSVSDKVIRNPKNIFILPFVWRTFNATENAPVRISYELSHVQSTARKCMKSLGLQEED